MKIFLKKKIKKSMNKQAKIKIVNSAFDIHFDWYDDEGLDVARDLASFRARDFDARVHF